MTITAKNRILLLNSLPIYGGGEFFVYLLAKKLKANGWDVHVSCLKDTELYKKCLNENIRLFTVNYPVNNNSGVLKIARKISQYIKHHNIDLVHSNTNYDRTTGAMAAKFAGIKHVTNIHSFHSIQHNITHLIRNRMLTDMFIADGEKIKQMLIEKDKVNPAKITAIKLGIEALEINTDETRKMIRNEFNIPVDELIIGNAARMVPFKGQEYLLRAFSVLKTTDKPAKLLIVGDGELNDKLHKLAAELGIEDKVIFAGFRKDIYDVFTAFDIYAHTSLEGGGEAFPFSVLHALERSLPVVLTDAGDMNNMVKEGYNGYLCEPGNTGQISDSLQKLINNAAERKRYGDNSNKLFSDEFTAEKMTERIELIYRKILN